MPSQNRKATPLFGWPGGSQPTTQPTLPLLNGTVSALKRQVRRRQYRRCASSLCRSIDKPVRPAPQNGLPHLTVAGYRVAEIVSARADFYTICRQGGDPSRAAEGVARGQAVKQPLVAQEITEVGRGLGVLKIAFEDTESILEAERLPVGVFRVQVTDQTLVEIRHVGQGLPYNGLEGRRIVESIDDA